MIERARFLDLNDGYGLSRELRILVGDALHKKIKVTAIPDP